MLFRGRLFIEVLILFKALIWPDIRPRDLDVAGKRSKDSARCYYYRVHISFDCLKKLQRL